MPARFFEGAEAKHWFQDAPLVHRIETEFQRRICRRLATLLQAPGAPDFVTSYRDRLHRTRNNRLSTRCRAGEGGDTLPDGTMAIENIATPSVTVLDHTFTELADLSFNPTTAAGSVRANPTLHKFVAISKTPNADEVKIINPDGTVASTHAITGINNMRALAVSNDGKTLYYSRTTGDIAALYRHDLEAGSALPNLVNLGTTTNLFDILTMADGTVLAGFVNGAGALVVRRYARRDAEIRRVAT